MKTPILRFHRPTKQWYVWVSATKSRKTFGRDPVLARQRYAAYVASLGGPPALPPPSQMTVADACEAYLRHARQKQAKAGSRPSEIHRVETALAAVCDLYGPQPASSFRARAFKDVRSRLLTSGKKLRSRNYVNKLGRAIQAAWRWLASEEYITAESAASVCLVRAIQAGEGGREIPSITPPQPGAVEAAIPHCPPLVRSMLRLQQLTGMRPGEVRRMRVGEVSRSPDQKISLNGTARTVAAIPCGDVVVWVYSPTAHKNLWRGKSRVVVIGPKAQAILAPYLDGKQPTDLVFRTRVGTQYRTGSYASAVLEACDAAGVPRWHPNQLRHALASDVAEAFDDHTAASMLGHAPGSNATRTYLEQAIGKAAEAAAQMG